ncbi:MAG TPA: 2-hydroxyacid dehydrogenase [Actinomycetota bacterium]|jgi:glycerate dehydrogenase
MDLLVVTFEAPEEQRAAITHEAGDSVTPVFLSELDGKARSAALRHATVLLSWNWERELSAEDRELLGSLRLVQFVSAGLDHVPFEEIPPDAAVAGNSGAYADPMAEHALAMALALAKRLPQRHEALRRGEFDQRRMGLRIRDQACAIVGYGGIGKATARLFRALGARILAINTSGRTDDPVEFCGTLDDLDRVLAEADVVVLTLPLTRRTEGLIGAERLALMKPEAIMVNVARGALVDEDALYEHLLRHPDFMAGIDAWWVEPFGSGRFQLTHPFLDLPNVLGSPHNSAIVPGALTEATAAAARNIRRFLRDEPVLGLADRADYARSQ